MVARRNNMKKITQHTQRGFTLLLATLISSLVLIIGTSMFSLAQKQVLLSSLGRDSQYAFYAADTGAECALYWDLRHQYYSPQGQPDGVQPTCDGTSIAGDSFSGFGVPMTFEFELRGENALANLCSRVAVTKYEDNPVTEDIEPQTIIVASGYNTPCDSIATDPRALERTVRLTY